MSTDTFEIEALDQPTFTQVGHWVAFRSDLSPTARHLYTVLATFVNQGRRANGDTDVWPSLNLLAVTLGLSKGESVTPYVDELIQADIVVKRTHTIGGMNARNTYAIRFNPPPGIATASSLKALLAPLKEIADDPKAMSKAAKDTRELIAKRREQEKAKRAGGKGKTAGRAVPRKTGVRAPESRGTHPGKPGCNKTQVELDAGRTTASSSSADAPAEREPAPAVEKKTKKTPEQIIIERLSCTEDEAAKVAVYINQQGDGKGGRIRSLSWWVGDRDIHTLRQDLAVVRGSQKPAGVSYDKDPGAYLRSINGSGYKPYKHPENQDAYDEPLLAPPAKVHTGARAPVPDHTFWEKVADLPQKEIAALLFGD